MFTLNLHWSYKMFLITGEFILVAVAIFYIAYLRTLVKLLREDVKKLKEEKEQLTNFHKD